MYADIGVRSRVLGGIYDSYIDLVGNGSVQSINHYISEAKGFKKQRVRIQTKAEVVARKIARKTGSWIEITALRTAKAIVEATICGILWIDEKIGDRYTKVTGAQFEQAFTEKDIFNLVRQVPMSVRKNPTYSSLASMFPTLSKRQIGKLRARIKKEMEYTGTSEIIPA